MHAKKAYLGSIFIPWTYVLTVCFSLFWKPAFTRMIWQHEVQVPPPPACWGLMQKLKGAFFFFFFFSFYSWKGPWKYHYNFSCENWIHDMGLTNNFHGKREGLWIFLRSERGGGGENFFMHQPLPLHVLWTGMIWSAWQGFSTDGSHTSCGASIMHALI